MVHSYVSIHSVCAYMHAVARMSKPTRAAHVQRWQQRSQAPVQCSWICYCETYVDFMESMYTWENAWNGLVCESWPRDLLLERGIENRGFGEFL